MTKLDDATGKPKHWLQEELEEAEANPDFQSLMRSVFVNMACDPKFIAMLSFVPKADK